MTKEKFNCKEISEDRKKLEEDISQKVSEFMKKYDGISITGTIRTTSDMKLSGKFGCDIVERIDTWINITI